MVVNEPGLCDILSTSVGVHLWHACSSCMVLGMDTGGQVSAMYLLFASSRSLSSSSSIPLAMDSIKLFQKNTNMSHQVYRQIANSSDCKKAFTFSWCLRLDDTFFLKENQSVCHKKTLKFKISLDKSVFLLQNVEELFQIYVKTRQKYSP